MTKFTVAVMFLTTTAFGQGRIVRLEDTKIASASDRVRFESALHAADVAPQQAIASHVAMVAIGGNPGSSQVNILAFCHTLIPSGSLIGLRVRRSDGTEYPVEEVVDFGSDILPNQQFMVKESGGGSNFLQTKQYELIVVEPSGLTTVDYIPLQGNVIQGSPTFGYSATDGNLYARISLTADVSPADAVVFAGLLVPKNMLSTEPGGVLVNLTQFRTCFGSGDVSVTVVRAGKSDTTQFRVPNSLQTCGVNITPVG